MTLSFSVAIKPRGKQRARFGRGHTYTPKQTVDFESQIAIEAKKNGAVPLPNACVLTITATFKRPKGMKYFDYCTKKPDWDNIGKIISDSLNGVAYFDDKQIVSGTCSKNYGDSDSVEIEIEYLA